MSIKDSLIAPLEFRFTGSADVEDYGNEWFRYDELTIVSAPAKVLIALEQEIGAPIASVMNGFRDNSVFGETAGAWLALKFAGKPVAYKDFSPATMLIEWRAAVVEQGKEQGSTQGPSPDTIVLEHADTGSSGSTEPPASNT